jgi:glycerol kinase
VVDVGTTACRTTLFDDDGNSAQFAYREYSNITPSQTEVEQNQKVWTSSIFRTVNACLKQTRSEVTQVKAIVVTSQRATIMPVDIHGKPLSNAILWLDKRGLDECKLIRSKVGFEVIYKRTGLRVDPYFSAPKILWMKRHRFHVYQATHKFLTVHDYVIRVLTGEMLTDETQASRTMLFNIEKREWDSRILQSLGVDEEKLPNIVPTGSIVGELSQEAAHESGLRPGVPVIAAGGDQQLAAIGMGISDRNKVGINTGSGSFVLAHVRKPLRDMGIRVLCSVASIPHTWMLEGGVFTTGSVYKWFKDNFGRDETIKANLVNKSVYEILDRKALTSVSSSKVVLLPHFSGSAAPYWNPLAKGLIFNLTLGTGKADILAGILTSICLEMKKNLMIIEKMLGESVRDVYVAGGASRSRLFNQLQADALGKRVLTVSTSEAVSLGGAMLAMVNLGTCKNLNECSGRLVRITSRFEPKPKLTKQYDRLLRLNEAIYQALNRAGIYEIAQESSHA